MAKEKEQKEALVRTVKIPVEVTVVSTGNETSVLLRAQVTDDVGRVWDSNSYGKGKDLKTALGDFHAEIARNPIKFSTLVERAVKGTGPIESSPVDANRTIQLSSTQESEILKGKALQDLMKANGIKITFPFGSTMEQRNLLVREAIAAKGTKKEAF